MRLFNFFNRVTRPSQVPLSSVRHSMGCSGETRVSEDSAMEASAFYRGVIYISTQIAKLPCEIKDTNNQALENDISYLLNVAANPEMNAMTFRLFMIQCAIVAGNGYAEIERAVDGRILALWPINPRRVRLVRDIDDELFYEVSEDYGKSVFLRPKDMFHVRNPHTDGWMGLNLISYASQTLGIAIAADRFANSLFSNGGMPSGILSHPGSLSAEAALRLKESWKQNHGGRKTGGTAVLEEGVTYSPISHSPEVLQFLDSRKFSVTEIARFLGLPPTKLFDTGAAKFNNLEHSNLEVATDTLDAWARIFESECDMKILSGRKGGRRTELNLYAIFRGDMDARSQYFTRMLQNGSITSNEIRLEEGRAPYPDGNRFYIASNNLSPVDRMDEVIDAKIKPKEVSKPSEETEDDNIDKEENDANEEAVRAVTEFLKSKTLN